MDRRTLLAAAGASLAAASAFAAEEKPGPGLSVAIAVGKRSGMSRSIEYRDAQSHFHVVLRNDNDKPLRVWREWCSWGYFCLTFQATTADGKTHTMKKAPQDWSKNYPDFEELSPGECVVREVFYGSAAWENFPRNPAGDPHQLKLQAIYEVTPDDESGKAGVWTGKVESPELEVAVWGWK
jgi:hypothetical protein